MAIFIIALFLACGLLFVWEAIIAPSIRLQLRFQMFAERDRLRALHATAKNGMDAEVFEYAHQYVNAGINCIHIGNIFLLARAELEFRRNKALQDQMATIVGLFNKSNNTELRAVRDRILEIGKWAVLVNSTIVLISVIPLAVIILTAVRVQLAVANFFWMLINQSGYGGGLGIPNPG